MMEIRRFVVHHAVGEDPRPAECVKCGGGPVDATDENEWCRECRALNGTGVDNLKRGFTFHFRIGGPFLTIRRRHRTTDDVRIYTDYFVFHISG